MSDTIKTVYSNQTEILTSIMTLNEINQFDVDFTYGNGKFYEDIPSPVHKYDLDPQLAGVKRMCSTNTDLDDSSIGSLVFDPPFLTYIKSAREHNSIMAKRFGGYWAYSELEEHYKKTLIEAHRVLRKKGIMVFKCQDIIHNHKMHSTHINIVNWADGMFRLKDMFILTAKSRMQMPETKGHKKRTQKHARIHHSYFLVLEKIGK